MQQNRMGIQGTFVVQMVKRSLKVVVKKTPHCKLLQTLFNEKKKDFKENTIISKVHTERT